MVSTGICWINKAAWPRRFSEVATIVTTPGAMVLTKPLPLTMARVGSLVSHSTGRSVTSVPAESVTVARNCTDCPSSTLACNGVTDTLATGIRVTCSATVSEAPSALATGTAPHISPNGEMQ